MGSSHLPLLGPRSFGKPLLSILFSTYFFGFFAFLLSTVATAKWPRIVRVTRG